MVLAHPDPIHDGTSRLVLASALGARSVDVAPVNCAVSWCFCTSHVPLYVPARVHSSPVFAMFDPSRPKVAASSLTQGLPSSGDGSRGRVGVRRGVSLGRRGSVPRSMAPCCSASLSPPRSSPRSAARRSRAPRPSRTLARQAARGVRPRPCRRRPTAPARPTPTARSTSNRARAAVSRTSASRLPFRTTSGRPSATAVRQATAAWPVRA